MPFYAHFSSARAQHSPHLAHPKRIARFARRSVAWGFTLFATAVVGAPLHAQSATTSPVQRQIMPGDTVRMTVQQARQLALRHNPELSTARLEIDVARGDLRQASLLRFNPSAELIGPGGGTSPELAVGQELEIAGQRGVRRSVASAGVSRANFGVADVARTTLLDVERRFYTAVAADRRAELAREILGLNERLAQAAARQLREGEISKLDYNLSVVELGRARARSFVARREQQQAVIELRRLTGLPATTPVAAQFDSAAHRHAAVDSTGVQRIDLSAFGLASDTSVEQLVQYALARRPDLAEREAAVQQAEAGVTLARREALPNLVARVLSQQNADGTGRSLRPGVGISLPLFNRNQGEVDARRAIARRTALERAATTARVRAEVETAMRSYQASAGEIEVLENTVLGPARENRRLLEAAYREGKVGLPVLLLIRNQVIDAEQEYWAAWLAEREAAALLAAALGARSADDAASPR